MTLISTKSLDLYFNSESMSTGSSGEDHRARDLGVQYRWTSTPIEYRLLQLGAGVDVVEVVPWIGS